MTLQETIVNDMRTTLDPFQKGVLKVLVAEFQRGLLKNIEDEEVTKIIRKCIKNEGIVKEHAKTAELVENCNNTIAVLSKYIKHTENIDIKDVAQWITANIDFSKFPNKMAAMKIIMQHFKGQIEGNVVKELLQNM